MKRLLAAVLLSAGLLPALPPAGLPQARHYALLLEDPPVATRLSSRSQLLSQPARDAAARIEAAQAALRQQLRARNVNVVGSVKHLLNAVFVAAPASQVPALRALPGVRAVVPMREFKLEMNKALPLVKAPEAWAALSAAGMPNPGAGVKIGIIDTGIDVSHAAFQDASLQAPDGYPRCSVYDTSVQASLAIACDAGMVNGKVIVARSYVPMVALGWTANPAETSHPDDTSVRDRVGHGTAVAMAAAGVVHDTAFGSMSGVAPKAYLGSYKIFGSPGVNDGTTEDAVTTALEEAFNDGMNIVNLSLGGPAWFGPNDSDCSGYCDTLAQAVESAVRDGMVVVIAAGNQGDTGLSLPTLSTVASPGTAPSAITAGGTRNAHDVYAKVAVNAAAAPDNLKSIAAAFGDGAQIADPLTAPVRDVGGLACDPLAAGSLTGTVALIQRGVCYFADKVRHAEDAGAVAAVIYCNDTQYCADGGDKPFGPTGLTSTRIPAVLIGRTNGQALHTYLAAHADTQLTLDPHLTEFLDTSVDTVTSFSSRGPSIAPDTALKPEVVAVASSLYLATQRYDANSDMFNPNGYGVVDGTSFSAPITAGVAALVLQKNPTFSPAQVKSAIVDTASDSPIVSGEPRISAIGGGKVDAEAAVRANVVVEPATLPFGAVTPLVLNSSHSLKITNNSASSLTLGVDQRDPDSNAHLRVTPTSVPANQATIVSVSLEGSMPQAGSYSGAVTIRGGAVDLRVPYHYLVGDNVLNNLFPVSDDHPTGFPGQQIPSYAACLRAIDRFGTGAVSLPVLWTATGGAGFPSSTDPSVCGGAAYTPCNLYDSQTYKYGLACALVDLGPDPGTQEIQATVGSGASALSFTFVATARLQPVINAQGVVNAASFAAANGDLPALAPGSYISIWGAGFSDATLAFTDRLAPGYVYLPLSLNQLSVSFDVPATTLSVPGRLHFVSPTQVNVQAPWELQGHSSALMKVSIGGLSTALYTISLADEAPGIFQYRDPGSGQLYAAAQIATSYQLIGPSSPVRRGDWIVVYANGLGPVTTPPATGERTGSDTTGLRTLFTVGVNIGGQPAPEVYWSGLAPNYVGLYQVNVRVPENAATGTQPVTLTVNGNSSPAANIVIQ